jgi:hypothetical protein
VFQEGTVEVEVTEERVVTSQSLSALTVTRWVTSRRIVRTAQIVSEGYEDVGALVVFCLEDEEGDVSHLGNDAL